jgi:hypothetical protein
MQPQPMQPQPLQPQYYSSLPQPAPQVYYYTQPYAYAQPQSSSLWYARPTYAASPTVLNIGGAGAGLFGRRRRLTAAAAEGRSVGGRRMMLANKD